MPLEIKSLSIRDALTDANEISRGSILYFPNDAKFNLDTQCALLTPWDWEEGGDPPEVMAVDNVEMVELLPMVDIQQVVANARQQRQDPSFQLLLKALEYYYNFDAFIDFDHENPR